MIATEQPLIPEITPLEAAVILAVSRKTIYRMIAAGSLSARRLTDNRRGVQYRIPRDEVVALRHSYHKQANDNDAAPRLPFERGGLLELELIQLDPN